MNLFLLLNCCSLASSWLVINYNLTTYNLAINNKTVRLVFVSLESENIVIGNGFVDLTSSTLYLAVAVLVKRLQRFEKQYPLTNKKFKGVIIK